MYEDKTLVCKECGKEFVFTAGEQEFYAERGFQNEPQRCKACRDARKNAARGPREYFTAVCAACGAVRPMRRRARCWPTACASCARPDGSAGSLRSCANTIMKGDSIVMHPILSKASLREPDTERLNTMLRVALTPLQYETVVAVYLHGHPQKEVAIDRGVSPASVCQLLQRAERRVGRYLGYL